MFTLSFDTKSIAAIGQMHGFSAFFTDSVGSAMQESGELLREAIQTNTWIVFKDPTGAMADSVVSTLTSPHELHISVDAPQARRLEYGFYGLDSLGRFYNQAPEPYFHPAVDENMQEILELFDTAVLDAFGRAKGAH